MNKTVLLVNLGTPIAPTPRAIKKYLKEFLSDPRVIELPKIFGIKPPRWLWWFLLNFIILPLRVKRVAQLYENIWTPQGSPLLAFSQAQQKALQAKFDAEQAAITVKLAMRYGEPGIETVMTEWEETDLIVLPLYPQYSATTTAAVFDELTRVLQEKRVLPSLEFVAQYADHPLYIEALVESIKSYRQVEDKTFLLFSFHGLPLAYVEAGDPYPAQCQATAARVAHQLQLSDEDWGVSFQSRFGRAQWLQPYTVDTLTELAHKHRRVQVICPGFSVDCLETLEEINLGLRAHFLACGGESFEYIPALNASEKHIDLLAALIRR